MAPKAGQARQQMLQLGQFHLQFAFARAGALRENVQDQRRAVQHLAAEDLFQIAALRGGKLIVEHHRIHVLFAAKPANSSALPLPMKVPADGGLRVFERPGR